MWIDEILAGSAAGEEWHSEYGWEDDYWIEAFLLRENGPGELLELRCEWAFEVSLNLFSVGEAFYVTDSDRYAETRWSRAISGVLWCFSVSMGSFFHKAELQGSSMYSDFGVCVPSQEGLAQATEL